LGKQLQIVTNLEEFYQKIDSIICTLNDILRNEVLLLHCF